MTATVDYRPERLECVRASEDFVAELGRMVGEANPPLSGASDSMRRLRDMAERAASLANREWWEVRRSALLLDIWCYRTSPGRGFWRWSPRLFGGDKT